MYACNCSQSHHSTGIARHDPWNLHYWCKVQSSTPVQQWWAALPFSDDNMLSIQMDHSLPIVPLGPGMSATREDPAVPGAVPLSATVCCCSTALLYGTGESTGQWLKEESSCQKAADTHLLHSKIQASKPNISLVTSCSEKSITKKQTSRSMLCYGYLKLLPMFLMLRGWRCSTSIFRFHDLLIPPILYTITSYWLAAGYHPITS